MFIRVATTPGEGLAAAIQPGTHGLAARGARTAMTLRLYAHRKVGPSGA